MRLWSLHPKYLDAQGLVALWRESLLAQAVLRGQTKGYRNHPQLDRFRNASAPRAALAHYLQAVLAEAQVRGYSFDGTKVGRTRTSVSLPVTRGQLEYEWSHLLEKLQVRSPDLYRRWKSVDRPQAHPLFRVKAGAVEAWERLRSE